MFEATRASVDVSVNDVIGSAPIRIRAAAAISISEFATDGILGMERRGWGPRLSYPFSRYQTL